MPRYFLGVDGGQSSTTALIGDETGRIAGRGVSGPCNHVGSAEGHAKFTAALTGCLSAACEQAGLDRQTARFEAACLGFSGGPADKEALVRQMIRANHFSVTHDAMIALTGATAGDPGIIVIAGTGSIAFGRNAARRTGRAGGWGYLFGDEGGAFDIVRQALRAALRSEEGWGPATSLHAALLEATAAPKANDLMHLFYTTEFPRHRIAAYASLIDEAARSGDTVAREILHQAARELAALIGAVRGQLFNEGEIARVSYVGGVFTSAILLERFRALVEEIEGNRLAPPAHGPAAGALIEAYGLAGLQPDPTVLPK